MVKHVPGQKQTRPLRSRSNHSCPRITFTNSISSFVDVRSYPTSVFQIFLNPSRRAWSNKAEANALRNAHTLNSTYGILKPIRDETSRTNDNALPWTPLPLLKPGASVHHMMFDTPDCLLVSMTSAVVENLFPRRHEGPCYIMLTATRTACCHNSGSSYIRTMDAEMCPTDVTAYIRG